MLGCSRSALVWRSTDAAAQVPQRRRHPVQRRHGGRRSGRCPTNGVLAFCAGASTGAIAYAVRGAQEPLTGRGPGASPGMGARRLIGAGVEPGGNSWNLTPPAPVGAPGDRRGERDSNAARQAADRGFLTRGPWQPWAGGAVTSVSGLSCFCVDWAVAAVLVVLLALLTPAMRQLELGDDVAAMPGSTSSAKLTPDRRRRRAHGDRHRRHRPDRVRRARRPAGRSPADPVGLGRPRHRATRVGRLR